MKPFIFSLLIFSLIISNPSYGQKQAKKITISGVVTDANQKPISDAIIFIDSQKTDIKTDEKGFYKIRVSSKALVISAFTIMNGVKEVEIAGRTMVNFSMAGSVTAGKSIVENRPNDETLNVGYGTMKKKNMTTSVGKIDGTQKRFGAYQNIYDMISGEVPGVQVRGRSIMIQGPSSINLSNEPLLVVDNVVVNSIEDIPPHMVKSIEILKGAACIHIWIQGGKRCHYDLSGRRP